MTDEELKRVWETIAGRQPQIITLVPYKRDLVSPAPRMGVYWRYSELTTPDKPLSILYLDKLTYHEPGKMLTTLAEFNNLLLVEPAFSPAVHEHLNQRLVREEFQREIARRAAEGRGRDPRRIVFHRVALLLNMKLILGLAGRETYQPEDDLIFGDIALLANDFISEDVYENNRDLILESLPTWEIHNPRDIAYSIARYDFLIRDYLSGNDAEIQAIRSRLGLDVTRFEGLLLDEYVTLMFGIHSLVRSERNCIFLVSNIAANLRITLDSINTFFQARSLSLSEFRSRFANGGWSRERFADLINNHSFVSDTTQLRRFPFIRLDEDRCLVLDILFVIELLTSGLYWSIFDSLPSASREDFSSLWGRVFELYTVGLFRHYYPDLMEFNRFRSDIPYNVGGNNGQIDALLDFGNETIVFEIKSSLLTLNAKCSRDWDALEIDLRRKFVENKRGAPKALRQLARASTLIAKGELLTGPAPNYIFPVLVVDEKAMECLGMNAYLNQMFRGFLDDDVAEKITPLTVISIDELEELLPHIERGVVTWQEVLRSRFGRGELSILSVHQALYNLTQEKRVPPLRNDYLLQRFEQMFARMRDLCIINNEQINEPSGVSER